jgi:spoIIIJ-associated protein
MRSHQWTFTAATAEEAVRKGLKKLGFAREQVEVEVLGEKKSGLFSLFGLRRMEVRLTEKPAAHRIMDEEQLYASDRPFRRSENRRDERSGDRPRRDRNDRDRPPRRNEPVGTGRQDRSRGDRDERNRRGPDNRDRSHAGKERPTPAPARRGPLRRESSRPQPPRREDRPQGPRPDTPSPDALLTEWKTLLGWENLSWTTRTDESGDIVVVFSASSAGRLMDKSGAPLEALDHLLHVVRARGDRDIPRVSLEIEGRSKPAEQSLIDEAMRAAAEVKRTGQPFRMEPMTPRDRRAIHQALANHPDVVTASEGEGPFRKVVVKPKN